MRKIFIVAGLLVLALALIFWFNYKLNPPTTVSAPKTPLVIGFSLGTTREDRWLTDRDLFVKKAQELGAVVDVTLSDYDVPLQISQIENLISQGVKVIVVVPADSAQLAPVIAAAHQAGVKIIAYDRIITDADLDFYISFDNVEVGKLEASSIVQAQGSGNFAYIGGSPADNNSTLLKIGSMSVLDSRISSGQIKLVVNQMMTNWNPDQAYKTIKNYLASGQKLDAVVAANDGTAGGVIQALRERGLAGQIPVSGQDAELSACQRIIDGTQTSTVYKPIPLEAEAAAQAAVAMALGQEPAANSVTNNGKVEVRSYLLSPTLVDRSNMLTTIVKDGFHSYQEIYKNRATTSAATTAATSTAAPVVAP
jgi:D-xylose transport system substrate-binding protein